MKKSKLEKSRQAKMKNDSRTKIDKNWKVGKKIQTKKN